MTNMNQIRGKANAILGVAHLVLSITSGWSLKHVTRMAYYSIAAFTLSLIYSIVGVLRFTHPNPTILRKISNVQTSSCVQLILPLLIAVDVLKLTEKGNILWLGVTTITATASFISLWLGWRILNHVFALWVVLLLAYVAYVNYVNLEENYWTVGLLVLISLNHFLIQMLPTHYDISNIEISTIGMCFFVVFALNSINEIAVSSDHLKAHGSLNRIR